MPAILWMYERSAGNGSKHAYALTNRQSYSASCTRESDKRIRSWRSPDFEALATREAAGGVRASMEGPRKCVVMGWDADMSRVSDK